MNTIKKTARDRIDEKLSSLNSLRPLPSSALKKLQEQFQIEMTYNSNGIEGNSLTLKETYLVINEGITIKGKPLKDHLEAKDHQAALEYLYGLLDQEKQGALSEQLIRTLHQIITLDTDKEWAGKYRTGPVAIGGSKHHPPESFDVPRHMAELIDWFREQQHTLHPIELAAVMHHKLVFIHSFFDGNGRTSRLVMNYIIMKEGYPMVILLKNDRKKYSSVLSRADSGEYDPLIRFIEQAVERSLDIYLKALRPTIKGKDVFLPLAEISKGMAYSAKYLNLLARQGKLEAHKDGRNWVTTREAIDRYLKNRIRNR